MNLNPTELHDARVALIHAIAQCEMRIRSFQRRRADATVKRLWIVDENMRRAALQMLLDRLQ